MEEKSASEQIDDIIEMYKGWKGDILSQLRAIIKAADPDMIEEVKWKMRTRPWGLPVWSHNGIVCFAETWKDNVKLLFMKGVHMEDPQKLFNARLNSSKERAIELHEGDSIDESALKALIHEAVQLNTLKAR